MTAALCTAELAGAGHDVFTWIALAAIACFVVSLVAVLVLVWWTQRPASGATVLSLKGRMRTQERAERADPRYDPKQFRRRQ